MAFFVRSLKNDPKNAHIGAQAALLMLFLLAGLSDVLDGFLARRLDIISNFGKVMDPVADKLMLLTIVVCLFMGGDLPLWIIVIILAKEAAMLLGGAVLLKRKIIIPANAVGKIGTALFTLAVFFAFLKQYTDPWYIYVMFAAVAFSIFSLIQYAAGAAKQLKAHT